MEMILRLRVVSPLLPTGQAVASDAPAPQETPTCLACHDIGLTKIEPACKDIAAKHAGKDNARAVLVERI